MRAAASKDGIVRAGRTGAAQVGRGHVRPPCHRPGCWPGLACPPLGCLQSLLQFVGAREGKRACSSRERADRYTYYSSLVCSIYHGCVLMRVARCQSCSLIRLLSSRSLALLARSFMLKQSAFPTYNTTERIGLIKHSKASNLSLKKSL